MNSYLETEWSGDQADYQPPVGYELILISSSVPVSVQGLDLTRGRVVTFRNVGTFAITFVDESSSATATIMRLDNPQDANLILFPGHVVTYRADGTRVRLLEATSTISTGGTSTATAGGTTTLTVSSDTVQRFTGTANQTVQLPDVTTLPTLGYTYRFINDSTTGTLTITSSGGGTITTVPPGQTLTVTTILLTGTTPASWSYSYVGTTQTPGFTTTATAGGTTTLTVLSTQTQQFTGTLNETVALPVVSTLKLGDSWRLLNDSTGVVTVQSSGGTVVATLASGEAATPTVVAVTGTGAASWEAQKTSTTGDSGGGAAPRWVKVTKTFADFSTAGITNTITLRALGVKEYVKDVIVKHSAAFTGGAISNYLISVGVTSSSTFYVTSFTVFAAPTDLGYTSVSLTQSVFTWTSGTNVTIKADSVGANLNAAVAGSVDVWLLIATLP